MILQALNELAENEKLTHDPDFELKPISWLIRVSKDGSNYTIIDIRQQADTLINSKKKPKLIGKNLLVPLEKAKTRGDKAFFLFDKAEYVFGIDPDNKRERIKLKSRFNLFRERVKECAQATNDEAVIAISKLLNSIDPEHNNVVLPVDAKSYDLFAFSYEPDNNELVTNRPEVRKYWKKLRSKATIVGEQHICLVSGNTFTGSAPNFPPTRKIPGGSPSGIALVSFNKDAFESYGWKGNENAQISRDSAEACAKALYRLVNPEPCRDDGSKLPKRHLRISDDTLVCFWTRQPKSDGFCDIFLKLMEPDPAEISEMYNSIQRGIAPDNIDESAFYVLVISGQQGRIIVRDWIETTISKAQANLARYFADLEIIRNLPTSKDDNSHLLFSIRSLLRSLATRGEIREIPAQFATHIINSALNGTPFPFAILQLALERERAEQARPKEEREYRAWLERRNARAALIKAVLNRRKRLYGNTINYEEVQPTMDPSNSSEGYILGQTLAVLERIQQLAQPDINATIIDRYFGSASSSPKGTFIRLLKNARYHVRKAQDNSTNTGTVILLDRLLDTLVNRFNPANNGFPSYLDINQQGLFILGYHHMRNWLWLNSEDREIWENAHPTAPAAYLWRTGKTQKKSNE